MPDWRSTLPPPGALASFSTSQRGAPLPVMVPAGRRRPRRRRSILSLPREAVPVRPKVVGARRRSIPTKVLMHHHAHVNSLVSTAPQKHLRKIPYRMVSDTSARPSARSRGWRRRRRGSRRRCARAATSFPVWAITPEPQLAERVEIPMSGIWRGRAGVGPAMIFLFGSPCGCWMIVTRWAAGQARVRWRRSQ